MKLLAALLLTVFLAGIVSANGTTTENSSDVTKLFVHSTARPRNFKNLTITSDPGNPDNILLRKKVGTTLTPEHATVGANIHDAVFNRHVKPLLNAKDMLLQEIRTLDEETSNSKIQNEVAKTLKAESQRFKSNLSPTSTVKAPAEKMLIAVNNTVEDRAMKKLLEDEDIPYDDFGDDEDEEDEDDDDDEYDDEDSEDELDDEEEVMTQCPDYCRCAGQYAAATTATCTKLVEEQSFGTGIAHLRIENAGEIRLGPHALRSRGLQQLESITITDTKIVDLNHTAFDGIAYLFAVNLTRNGLQDIHPNTFQNNTQLSLLAISGNPLKHTQDSKLGKHGLFDAPSVTEFDFSNNGLTRLKRNAFARMQSLVYVNLKGNRLREIDSMIFNSLESLVEVDLSNNLLNDIPVDLLYNKGVQTLRVSGNNLTTLAAINAPKLTVLDAANNRIKIVDKHDLAGVPLLDQLNLNSNGMRRIHQHAFDGLEQLTALDISDNKLTAWTEHHLRTNSRLQVLKMSDNPGLDALPVFKTSGLEYDTYSVYHFECANCGLYYLEEGTFNAMPAITRLNLAKNRLTGLPNGLLSRLSSLRVLDLSDNIIGTLNTNMFRGATSLTKLSLAGNPLVTLQVAPFLNAPGLTRLDVSRCALERVWNEARVPLYSLRFLSVRENLLRRITVEELRATPKLSSLDISHNPLDCDSEFNEAVQWLTDHGVTPTETLKYASNYGNGDDYPDSEGISKWTDLGKIVCDGVSDGPPPRPVPHKEKNAKDILAGLDSADDSDRLLKNELVDNEDLLKMHFDHGVRPNEELEKAWTSQDQEYEIYSVSKSIEYQPWYTDVMWSVIIVVIATLVFLLITVQIAVCLAKRRGRGPVIRPPMILRQGFIDNKNCGLVYKPLQEEIPTPHMPKRGSFYSSSTFHYDKIVPESV